MSPRAAGGGRGEGRGRGHGPTDHTAPSPALDLFSGAAANAEGGAVFSTPSADASGRGLDPHHVPGATPAAAVAVGTVARLAKEVIEGAFIPLWVRGEITEFKAHRNGHWYFCLRDETAQLRCVVWSRDTRRIPAQPDEGMQVTAFGQPTVYAARGDVQIAVTRLEAAGDGLRRKAFRLALAALERDGLLAPERKRRLPLLPRCVGVVTSPDGAALRDVVAVVRRRCPFVDLVVAPARVQGDGAAEEVIAAVDRVSRWGGADVVIVGRGGGARDDLWAFNDERVARALAACAVPTISAVGHETDVSLCDLVADHRAATPSAAAEAAVPALADLRARVRFAGATLRRCAESRLAAARERSAEAARLLARTGERAVERRRASLGTLAARLEMLSPLATLARGYAVVRDPSTGATISSIAGLATGQSLEILVQDGAIRAAVAGVSPDAAVPAPRRASEPPR